MIKDTFCGMDYYIWDVDLTKFSHKSILDNRLEIQFKEASTKPYPGEAIGVAYSTPVIGLDGFQELLNFLSPSLNNVISSMGLPLKKQLMRAWANRMHKDSSGRIHAHNSRNTNPQDRVLVLILYYNIPENSGDLVMIDQKYKDRVENGDLTTEDMVPSIDKRKIPVYSGKCVLHSEEILHSVSKHLSEETRDAIILEFRCY